MTGCGKETAEAPVAAGKLLPPLEFPDLDGRTHGLSGAGQALLLNFWATWCPPCRAEMAGLDRLYRQWRPAGLGIYGISIDDDINLVREFVLQNRIGFPILFDRAGLLTKATLALRTFPTTLLVARDGRIVEVVVGQRPWDQVPGQDAARALLAR